MATVTFHAAGELPASYTPGDIVLVSDPKSPDTLDQLIQAGERKIAGHTAWANLNHSAAIATEQGGLIESNRPGVQRASIEKYRDADIYIVHVDATPAQRALCVARWESCVGMEYDVVGFVGLALWALLGWPVVISDEHGLICSALVSFGALAHVRTFPKPYQAMTPTDLAIFFGVQMDEPPVPLGFFARFLDGLRTAAQIISPF